MMSRLEQLEMQMELSCANDEIADLKAKLAERQKFKDWVHAYLDAHGVPNHPPGTHGEHGCRIGDRMDWLMAKLTDSEREREALQKAQDLLNKGFESAAEQMHELKQAIRGSEAARLKAEAARGEMRKAMDVVSVREVADMTSEERVVWQAAIATDAGQPILDFIAAARRLRDKLNTSKMLVDHAGEVALAIADVDAAEAKLGGKP